MIIGVAPKSVGRWESGHRSPDTNTIGLLSDALDFPPDYFFGPPPPMLENWAFRSFVRMTAKQRDMALAAGAQAICLDQWLDRFIERPKIDVPDMQGQLPEDAADEVRASWGLGYRPLPNTVHLMESRGIRVYSLVHDGADFDAFSVWYDRVPFVFLNTTTTPQRRRMDACHEIAHLVLHAHTGGGETKHENREAAQFAAALLMPAAAVVASMPQRISVASVIAAKQQWGVSALAYARRLHELGRISPWQYKSLCIKMRTQYGTDEPGPAQPPELSKVLDWVFSSGESGISRQAALEHLQIPMHDLEDMIFPLRLRAMEGEGGSHGSPPGDPPNLRLA